MEWYLERSEPAAQEFVVEVDRAVALVGEAPSRWPLGEHNTRRFVLQRFPFAVTYREGIRTCKFWLSLMDTADPDTGRSAFRERIQSFSSAHGLTSYDAAYLDLS